MRLAILLLKIQQQRRVEASHPAKTITMCKNDLLNSSKKKGGGSHCASGPRHRA